MHIINKLQAGLLALVLAVPALAQTTVAADDATAYIGYTAGSLDRNKGISLSSDLTDGAAICLPAAKAQALKGAVIKGISLQLSSMQSDPTTLFVTKELGGEPLAQVALTYEEGRKALSTAKMADVLFNQPVTIDGSPLYIGYTCKLRKAGYFPILFDYNGTLSENLGYVLVDGTWKDASAYNIGAPAIRFILGNVPEVADVMVKPFSTLDYYRAGESFQVSPKIYNCGTATIHSIEVTTKVNDGAEIVKTIDGLNIAPNTFYDLAVAGFDAINEGRSSVDVSVSRLNGVPDSDPSDNVTGSSIVIYPANMKRHFLLEGFTGQECVNCPRGHEELKQFIAQSPEDFVQVSHHSGYYPDAFTMTEDIQYVWFYGTMGNFAPAAMLDRTPSAVGLSSPVAGNGTSLLPELKGSYAVRKPIQPYVSVDLTNSYDEATRKCKVDVTVHTYNVPSNEMHTLNLWLTQDGIIAYQSGGGNQYSHDHVFRGSLTGAWGEEIELKEGETITKSFEYEMPSEITSSYTGSGAVGDTFATDPAKMHWVAFVGDVTTSPITCTVWNSNTIDVTENGTTSGIVSAPVETGTARAVVVGNQLAVTGDYRTAKVYSLAGQRVATLSAGERVALPAGVYLVQVDAQPAQKVLVR